MQDTYFRVEKESGVWTNIKTAEEFEAFMLRLKEYAKFAFNVIVTTEHK